VGLGLFRRHGSPFFTPGYPFLRPECRASCMRRAIAGMSPKMLFGAREHLASHWLDLA
jgi:hypothetical protein